MKSEQFAVRVTSELLNKINNYAKEHNWTRSFAVCEILENHFNKNYELSGDLR